MDLEIKFLRRPDSEKDRLNVIARGVIDAEALKQILSDIAERTQHPFDGEVLVDLRNGTCSLKTGTIYAIANELKANLWPLENKVAMVSARDIEQYDQILLLSSCVSNRGFKLAAFYDLDRALQWLSQKL
jgi:hypothetical protein